MKTSARARRVGLYLRISDDREGAGLGVERQKKECLPLISQLGWHVVEIYDDNDMSATDRRRKRKGYHRMLADMESGHIDAVVAWHPDRLYRQPRELEDLMDLLDNPNLDVELRTARTGTIDLSTPDGRMLARIQVAVAKREVEHRRERILSKVEELVVAGKIHNSGHRAFGYDRHFDGTGERRKITHETVNEEEARWIRRWADRALAGETMYSLVMDAVDNGVKTTTGGDFSHQAMRFMLKSGRISGRKEHKGVIRGKAVWPAIITPEKSDALRALLAEHSAEYKAEFGERDSTARKYPLSGLPRCTCKIPHIVGEPCSCAAEGRRHHRMSTGQRGDKIMGIYTCKRDTGGCGGRTIQIPDLEPLMEELLFKRLEKVEAAAEGDPHDPRPALEAKLARWEQRKAELEEELLDGDRPAREIRDAIDKLNVRMGNTRRVAAEYSVKANLSEVSAAELRREWKGYSVARKQSVYRGLIKEILIHPATRPFNRWNPDRVEVFWK
ncbi:recombinase family protein [Streptomyces sp. NPDC002690]